MNPDSSQQAQRQQAQRQQAQRQQVQGRAARRAEG
jgi:hypothetical protein